MALSGGSYVSIHWSEGLDEVKIERSGRQFILSLVLDAPERELTDSDIVVRYPLLDYASVYKSKGCNVYDSMKKMLIDLRASVNEMSVADLQAWAVLFAYYDEDIVEGSRTFTE